MILDREIYFPYPFHKRVYLFIKKFFFILVRFLGRPTWGRPKAGIKLELEKQDMVLLVTDEGKIKCNSCNDCISICPTNCIDLVRPKDKDTPVAPIEFNFRPLECMYCNLCEEVCPEDALAFVSGEKVSGPSEQKWERDINYLSFRTSLNEGKGLTMQALKDLRKS